MSLLSAELGIDLGTANTVVCRRDGTILLNEPSVMLVYLGADGNRRPILVGRQARELTGRTPVGMATVRPIRDGVVTDLQSAKGFINVVIHQVTRRPWERFRPRAICGVPAGATGLERQALVEALEEAGIGHADLIPEPVAGAIGCGIDPLEARAHMVVDVGGGTAEVTAICFGGILAASSCRVAGDEMTAALNQYLRQEHHLIVGELTAEDIKIRLRKVDSAPNPIVVEGRDVFTGKPRMQTLDPDEAALAIRPTVDGIVEALAEVLDRLPPQAVGDIMQGGVLAFGGGSLLEGFQGHLEDALGFSVTLAERPLTCVAEGAAKALSTPRLLAAFKGAPPQA
ncbi:MAG: rod shape-determining protein [Candidatus Dormibacteraeota bacterium]|nr:rod shape-determining protein [Candidatus Dormibacteraeota bacterium]